MNPSRRSLPALAGGLLLSVPALAQTGGDEAAIAQRVEAMRAAMVARDTKTLEEIVAPQLSYGHSSARIENRTQFVENLMNGAPFKFINLSNQTIALAGDAAIVRHTFNAEQERDGRVSRANIGVLQVWQKQSGTWKLLARQAFTLPS